MGLFEIKDEPPPPALAAGRPIEAGEWALRLDRASLSDQMPYGGTISGAGRKAIILYVQATNRTAETGASFLRAIKLDTPVKGIDAQPTAYLERDRALTTELQPALPEEIALVWTFPADAPAPAKLRFAVTASTYKKFDNLYAQPGWFNPSTIGIVDVPLTPEGATPIGGVS